MIVPRNRPAYTGRMDTPKLFIATKALIVRDGKVLVVRESGQYKDGTNAGRFDVIGGRMEPGQSFEDNLRREVREETGLKVVVGRPFFVNEAYPVVRGEQWQVVRIFFECEAPEGEVKLSEDHDAFAWIDPQSYKEAGLIENLFLVFETYLARP